MEKDNRALDKNENTSYDAAYKAVRTNIEFLHTEQDLKVILVVAPEEQSGKCKFVQNLAIVLASKERKVLLMDCDLHQGILTKYMGMDDDAGVSELLSISSTKEKREQIVQNVYFMPCGKIVGDPSELFLSYKAGDCLKDLCQEYDYIILDAPAMQEANDAIDLSRVADGVVMLIQADTTKMKSAENCKKRLQAVNAKIIGAVLNGGESI